MPEEPKRLALTKEVARELYLKSGNECAFSKCNERIIDEDGDLVGEVCHIEAAEREGQRFNEDMTNEDRRAFPNLILMCSKHHKKTNNVEKYTVEVLQKMKADHERRFTDVVDLIRKSGVVDYAAASELQLPRSLKALNKALEWGTSPDNDASALQDVVALAKSIHRLPETTRELLTIIVSRADHDQDRYSSLTVPFREVVDACRGKAGKMAEQIRIMERYKIAEGDTDSETGLDYIELTQLDGWDFWSDLKKFCEKTEIPLEDFTEGLRFDKLGG